MKLKSLVVGTVWMATVVVALGGCQRRVDATTQPTPRPQRPPIPLAEVTLELSGAGLARPQVLSYADLRACEIVRLDRVLMQRSHGPDVWTAWRGPALAKLLDAAGIKPGPMTFRLEARDGYRMNCTADELGSAIVALQDGDGRWLAESDPSCPLRLVPPQLPGNYWIMNVSRIVVEPAAGPAKP